MWKRKKEKTEGTDRISNWKKGRKKECWIETIEREKNGQMLNRKKKKERKSKRKKKKKEK